MIFRITIKAADDVYDEVIEAAKRSLGKLVSELPPKEFEALFAARVETFENQVCRYAKYGNLFTLEFDTEKDTAVVVSSQ